MTPEKTVVFSEKAPKPIGPYSHAIKVGNFVFVSGQAGIDPANNELVRGGIEIETRQTLTNLKHILEASGSSLENVVKTTVFLRDIADFPKMNGVYAEFFKANPPARSTVQVSALPKAAGVEIEAIALINFK